ETLVRRAGTPRTAITLVAVSAGPGSYTGIRIGVAAAKALAWALGVPALAIPTLEVIARNAPADGDLAVILDARRGACYGATFRRRGGRIERTGDDRVAPPGEFLETLPEGTRLIGQGAYTLPGTDRFPRFGEESAIPRAELVHAAAGERLTAIRAGTLQPPPEFADPHLLVPSYLRPSEAEERAAARKQRGEEA
ncbi:MAG: tRNA (adenosine(37)-N6)-threonylcarbamoyltransferase complex dimerization subunit type 1 TsaB, partial [Planctomycetota bacterium]